MDYGDFYGQVFFFNLSVFSLHTHSSLTLNFLEAVVNTVNTHTNSSKEMAEFSFENADIKSICCCKQRMKSKLSVSSEGVETKLCKPYTSFTSHLHSSCGMVWYRTLRVKQVPIVTKNCLSAARNVARLVLRIALIARLGI